MPVCFFACDDTSVLYCNDDCLKFFREQAPGTESPAAAQKAARKPLSGIPGISSRTIHLLHVCISPDRLCLRVFPG